MDSQRRIQLQFDQVRSRSEFIIYNIKELRFVFVFSEKAPAIT